MSSYFGNPFQADSSGLIPHTSSRSGGPSDSSIINSGGYHHHHHPMAAFQYPPNPAFLRGGPPPGKNMNLLSKSITSNPPQLPPPSFPPSTIMSPPDPLSHFQQQMSQMKDAMDQVQKEILHSSPESPRGRGRPPKNPHNPTYKSQISTTNGLVMKIRKKLPTTTNPKTRGRKPGSKKKKKRLDEDIVYCGDDDSEEEQMDIDIVKQRRVRKEDEATLDEDEGDGSEWGRNLPMNVLKKILGLVVESEGAIPALVRISRVSKLWREASLDQSLWTAVDLSTGKVKDKYRSERNLIYFLENKFSHAVHLNLGGWSSAVTSTGVDVLINTCPNLESLNLSTCYKLTAQNVKSIAENCTRLNKLDLGGVSSVYNTRNAVSPSGIGEAAEVFGHRLLHLSLASNCMGNLPQVLTSIAENCANLQVLDLSNTNSPRRDAILLRIEELQIGCPNLRVLRLTNSDIVLGEVSIKDQMTSPGFEKLEELSIAVDPKRSQGMGDNDLERIVKNAVKLRLFDARGCAKISDSGLVRLPAWDLEHLYISGSFATKSSRDGLELIFTKWRHSLKDIDISWTPCEETIDLALRSLSDGGSLSPLRSLDLSGSSVSFRSLRLLLERTPNLQSINLTSCRALPRGLKRNYLSSTEIFSLREQAQKEDESQQSQ